MIGGRQHDLRHHVEMRHRDQALQAKAPAHQSGEAHHHGEAGIHGADDEIGREDRFLPTGHQARREIHADDAVQRHDQRHAKTGEREMQRLVSVPLARRAAPAEREAPRRSRRAFGVGRDRAWWRDRE